MAGALSLLGLLVFTALLGGSILVYPGGSASAPQAKGFCMLSNYWCDLLATVAQNGAGNELGCRLARSAFVAIAASLLAFWPAVARLVRPGLRQWMVGCGTTSALAIPLLAVLTYEEDHWTHALTLLTAGGLGLVATLLCLLGVWRARSTGPTHRILSVAMFASALANMIVYSDLVLRGRPTSLVLPLVQKIATVCLLLWLVATVLAARSRSAKASR